MKQLLVLSLILVSLQCTSQIDAGTQLLEGYMNGNLDIDGDGPSLNEGYRIGLGPGYTYFFRQNWGLHARAQFTMADTKTGMRLDSSYYYSSRTQTQLAGLSLGVSRASQLFYKLYVRTDFMLQGTMGTSDYTYESNGGTQTQSSRTNTAGAFIRPGILYFMTPHFTIGGSFAQLGYTYTNTKENDRTNNSHTIGLGLNGISFSLGYVFGSKAR